VATLGLLRSTQASENGSFGAVATAAMPRGSLSMYGVAGYPALRAGLRQGLETLETGGEVAFDYRLTKVALTGAVRGPLLSRGALELGWSGQLGAFASAGARYYDPDNARGAGLRLEGGLALSYQTSWPLAWIAYARMPLEVPLTRGGCGRFSGVVGAGAEVAVSEDSFVLFTGGFGPEVVWSPARTVAGLAVEASVGFGYRLF